jgi:3-oxoacyl-(acyl-carrier-protein) synthase
MKAMELAISRSKVNKKQINFIDAHATSTPAGD